MIDFKELPADGIAFEQLLREMFLKYGMTVHWTGRGPDNGRDLLVLEPLVGQLACSERKWLVQCKHSAHSGKGVGRTALGAVIDDCNQASASGYLLACSTVPSAGLITKLEEIERNPTNRLVTRIWDHVEIERRLDDPRLFSLAQLFFPKSTVGSRWRLYNAGLPNKWTANCAGCFVIIMCRIGGEPPPLGACEVIIDRLLAMRPEGSDRDSWFREDIRPRLIYWDDKHSDLRVYADYLLPESAPDPLLTPQDFETRLQEGVTGHERGEYIPPCLYFVRTRVVSMVSDYYHRDAPGYYKPYEAGEPNRTRSVGDLAQEGNRWRWYEGP